MSPVGADGRGDLVGGARHPVEIDHGLGEQRRGLVEQAAQHQGPHLIGGGVVESEGGPDVGGSVHRHVGEVAQHPAPLHGVVGQISRPGDPGRAPRPHLGRGGCQLGQGLGRQDDPVGRLGGQALDPRPPPGHRHRHLAVEPAQGRSVHRLAGQQAAVVLQRLAQGGVGLGGVHPQGVDHPAAAHPQPVDDPARGQLGQGGDGRGGGHRVAAERVGDGRSDGEVGGLDDGGQGHVHVALGALVGHETGGGPQRLGQPGQLHQPAHRLGRLEPDPPLDRAHGAASSVAVFGGASAASSASSSASRRTQTISANRTLSRRSR